ncbi:unnamed protein product [Haemonchus placei]|uniref:Secreted protein n=1 Tax=Haemonchus placei TaxID=6290 RepID=A0A0N4WLT2_HAEPC|nr:unnamed protein product [Haemonchus placei]
MFFFYRRFIAQELRSNTKSFIFATSATSALAVFISCARISYVVNQLAENISSGICFLKKGLKVGTSLLVPS